MEGSNSPSQAKYPKFLDEVLSVLDLVYQKKEEIVDDIQSKQNRGQRRKMVVLLSLLSSMFFAVKEMKINFKKHNFLSVFLLVRYAYETTLEFQYIFLLDKRKIQNKVDAFYSFTEMEREKLIDTRSKMTVEKWRNAIHYSKKKSMKNHWSGKSRDKIACAVRNYYKKNVSEPKEHRMIYKGLSIFSHPSMYSSELLFEDNMNIGEMSGDSIEYCCMNINDSLYAVMLKEKNIKFILTERQIKQINDVQAQINKRVNAILGKL